MTEVSSDFASIEAQLGELLSAIAPAERRALASRIGRGLRRTQASRIAEQKNPDGSPFVPRRPRMRDQRGSIKRRAAAGPMFRKLRQARWLRQESSAEEIAVGFAGAAVRIARVHQYGLRDRVSKEDGAPEVTYAARGLLGFTAEEASWILDLVTQHLAEGAE